MWQFMMGFGLGVYVGTKYDCKPTVEYISNFLDKTIPEEAKPKKKRKGIHSKNRNTNNKNGKYYSGTKYRGQGR